MTQSVVLQGKLRREGEGPAGAAPRGLVSRLMSVPFLPLRDRSRPVRKPDRLLFLGLGAEGARRGQPGTRPASAQPPRLSRRGLLY